MTMSAAACGSSRWDSRSFRWTARADPRTVTDYPALASDSGESGVVRVAGRIAAVDGGLVDVVEGCARPQSFDDIRVGERELPQRCDVREPRLHVIREGLTSPPIAGDQQGRGPLLTDHAEDRVVGPVMDVQVREPQRHELPHEVPVLREHRVQIALVESAQGEGGGDADPGAVRADLLRHGRGDVD